MSKTVWMFPGQGAQKAGMAKDFYENSALAGQLFDEADAALDFDLKAICFEENEKIHQTEYTQPCLVTACLAIAQELRARGRKPDMTAGLSLGEYAAIAAAGGMGALDAIRLVRRRGLLMQNTVPAGVGSMCAVLGMETAVIEDVIADMEGVTVANYNCPGQPLSFPALRERRGGTGPGAGVRGISRVRSALLCKCDRGEGDGSGRNRAPSGEGRIVSCTLAAERGGYDCGRRGYLCGNRSGADNGWIFEKNQSGRKRI